MWVFVELPEVGTTLAAAEEAGVVESVKAASDIYAPVGGEVIAINEQLEDEPETVNSDPYNDGCCSSSCSLPDSSETGCHVERGRLPAAV